MDKEGCLHEADRSAFKKSTNESVSSEDTKTRDDIVVIYESDSESLDSPPSDSNFLPIIQEDESLRLKKKMDAEEEAKNGFPAECTRGDVESGKRNVDEVKRMQTVFGLLCMAFKNDPYEFTLATMSHYVSGVCDTENHWLNKLDSYIEELGITELYVLGHYQKSIIERFVHNAPIFELIPKNLPCIKWKCRNCKRFGCSKFKCESILRHNFFYNFYIPCSRPYF